MTSIVAQVAHRSGEDHSLPTIVLASGSRYRRELLSRLRVPFDIARPDVDEAPNPGESPVETAVRLAQEKAADVATHYRNALVIGSDQVATFDGVQIGKPYTHEKALEQLKLMRARTVTFHTALCLIDTRNGIVRTRETPTRVHFRNLPDAELDAYLRAEQPYDCAGSAKSEGLGIALIERMEGDDPNALIGLPLIALVSMLREAGYPIFA